jgi:hypothetical protein
MSEVDAEGDTMSPLVSDWLLVASYAVVLLAHLLKMMR